MKICELLLSGHVAADGRDRSIRTRRSYRIDGFG